MRRMLVVAAALAVSAGCSGSDVVDGELGTQAAEEVHTDLVAIATGELGPPDRSERWDSGRQCQEFFGSTGESLELVTTWALDTASDSRAETVLDAAESYLRARSDTTEVTRGELGPGQGIVRVRGATFESGSVSAPDPAAVVFLVTIAVFGPCR